MPGLARLVAIMATLGSSCTCGDKKPASDAVPPAADAWVTPPYGLDELPPNTSCLAPARPPPTSKIKLVEVFKDITFSLPMGLFQAPGDDSRWYLVEQGGTIKVFDNDPDVSSTTEFLETPLEVDVGTTWEGGLLGFAFHPDYAENGTAFLAYTVTGTNGLTQRIARFKRNASEKLAMDQVIFEQEAPAASVRQEHNFGTMTFGPDGYLYVGLGDGYVHGDDPANPAQDPSSVFGKILRIDVGPAGPYSIPDGNPYKAGGGAPEVYALGFRNPWRFSFDRANPSDLWVADVGDDTWEEVNKVELGKNYGWSAMEGDDCHAGSTCDETGKEPPLASYGHVNGLLAVIGGYVYRGSEYPSLDGTYFYGDLSGRIWALPNGTPPAEPQLETGLLLTSFAEGNDGELYVLAYDEGNTPARIFRIEGLPPPGPSSFPETLSATGCVDPEEPTRPAPGLVPFDVNSPLWSDGGEKRRWLALPTGTQIQVRDDGDFEFPIGTVLVKEFRLEGEPVETRLFMRHDDGDWGGYSYEWSDDASDAHLLSTEKTKSIAGQSWFFPSRDQCLICHTVAAGRALGPELGQLNSSFTYEETGRTANQLVTLEHLELLDRPIGDPASLPRLPDPFGTDPLEARARAYLHANCSFCHRPDGTGRSKHNLLYAVELGDTQLCNAQPVQGNTGVDGALLLVPGDPALSLLSVRMKSLAGIRMPPLATFRVHDEGVDLIDEWIQSLSACP